MRSIFFGAGTAVALAISSAALADNWIDQEKCLNLYRISNENDSPAERWVWLKNRELCALIISRPQAETLANEMGKPLDLREGAINVFENGRAAILVTDKKPLHEIVIGIGAAIGGVLIQHEFGRNWNAVNDARDAEDDAWAHGDTAAMEDARREREREESRCVTCFNTDVRDGQRVYDSSHGHGEGGSHNTGPISREEDWRRRNM